MIRPRVFAVFPALALLSLVLVSVAAPLEAQARSGPPNAAVGFILGEPSGLSAKVWLHRNHALDLLLAYDISDEAFSLAVDYHVQFDPWPRLVSWASLPIYVGVGGKFAVLPENKRHDRRAGIGVRVPLGISMFFRRVPLELFFEIAPGVRVLPDTDADVDGGVGLRFCF